MAQAQQLLSGIDTAHTYLDAARGAFGFLPVDDVSVVHDRGKYSLGESGGELSQPGIDRKCVITRPSSSMRWKATPAGCSRLTTELPSKGRFSVEETPGAKTSGRPWKVVAAALCACPQTSATMFGLASTTAPRRSGLDIMIESIIGMPSVTGG